MKTPTTTNKIMASVKRSYPKNCKAFDKTNCLCDPENFFEMIEQCKQCKRTN